LIVQRGSIRTSAAATADRAAADSCCARRPATHTCRETHHDDCQFNTQPKLHVNRY
jgi:hypothetical protein